MRIHEWENGETIHIGADSSVIIIPWSTTVLKKYTLLSQQKVHKYAKLHRLLSREWWCIQCSDRLREHFWINLQRIQFEFLDLWEDITSLRWAVIHTIPYIPWDTLGELWKYITCTSSHISVLIEWIERELSQYMADKIWTTIYARDNVTTPHIADCNVKIVDFTWNILTLIVTDIGSSMQDLLETNQAAIDKILQP